MNPTPEAVLQWAEAEPTASRPLFVVTGTQEERRVNLKAFSGDASGTLTRSWVQDGVVQNVLDRLRQLRIFPGKNRVGLNILWALVTSEDFIVEEPLRGMVDHSFYLIHDLYRLLWEARFTVREGNDPESVIDAMTRWISREPLRDEDTAIFAHLGIDRLVRSPAEQFDITCFLLTMAAQNGLVGRVIWLFDDLEEGLKQPEVLLQLESLIRTISRWIEIGRCPLGIIIGFQGTKADMALLRRRNARLFSQIRGFDR